MGFFTWKELQELSKKIAVDVFVKRKNPDAEDLIITTYETNDVEIKTDADEFNYDDEIDFEQFNIKMRNPAELDKELNDVKTENNNEEKTPATKNKSNGKSKQGRSPANRNRKR